MTSGDRRDGSHQPQPTPDSALVGGMCDGDEAALEKLVSRYAAAVERAAFAVLGDAALAEAVTWRVFQDIWEQRESWTPRTVPGFLVNRARTFARNEIRARGRRREREVEWVADRGRSRRALPDDVAAHGELAALLDAALEALPRRQRQAFLLRVEWGLTYRQVAAEMETSPRTAEHQVAAARARLRVALGGAAGDWMDVAGSGSARDSR